ncbi:signal peptidase I [Halobacteriaceae archaeon GCM10025711]
MGLSESIGTGDAALVGLLLVVLVPFAVVGVPQLALADHSYVVMSSSMSPDIAAGDVVIVRSVPPETIQEGDVITFGDASGPESLTTHRVVDVTERDGTRYFTTKGDANEEADRQPVPASSVVGRVAFHIPYIGHVVLFAQTQAGLALMVILPGILLAVSEMWNLVQVVRHGDEQTDGTERV